MDRDEKMIDGNEATISVVEHSLSAALSWAQQWVYEVNVANGWFDDARSFGDDIALLHSEVSEMFEEFRDHGFEDMTAVENHSLPKPLGVGSEAADILVRLLDTCMRHDIDLAAEFTRKVKYNATRGYRHGGKRV